MYKGFFIALEYTRTICSQTFVLYAPCLQHKPGVMYGLVKENVLDAL